MSNVALYIELKDGHIKKSNYELLTLSQGTAILFADDISPYKEELASYGISEIVNITGVGEYNPESYATELAKAVKELGTNKLIASCSAQGKDLLPRVAAILTAPMITDCTHLDISGSIATKPTYTGKIDTKLKVTGDIQLFTMRPNSVTAKKADSPSTPTVKEIKGEKISDPRTKIIEIVKSVTSVLDLTEAEIIVSAGRGIGSEENFKIIRELADVLGAAVGASRAAVDAQYADQAMQVGQTGKTVGPRLYIACGISGAIQHFAGMKTSKVIVAINKDAEAPIFGKADYGIVDDLFTVVPMLTEEFRKVLEK